MFRPSLLAIFRELSLARAAYFSTYVLDMLELLLCWLEFIGLKIGVIVKMQYKSILQLLGVYKHISFNLSSHEASSGIRWKYSFYEIIIVYFLGSMVVKHNCVTEV